MRRDKNNLSDKPMHIFIFPLIWKPCAVCGKYNPPSAKYCGYCGSSYVITRMRPDDKSPGDATVPQGAKENIYKLLLISS